MGLGDLRELVFTKSHNLLFILCFKVELELVERGVTTAT